MFLTLWEIQNFGRHLFPAFRYDSAAKVSFLTWIGPRVGLVLNEALKVVVLFKDRVLVPGKTANTSHLIPVDLSILAYT